MPTRLDHCVIHVSDWERSNKFYTQVMGAELVARPAGFAYRFGDKQLNVHGPGVKPAEVASDVYRFEIKVPAGKTETHVVTEERIINQGFQVSNIDDNAIRIFLTNPVTSDKVKKGLQNAMELRYAAVKTQRDLEEQDRQLKVITEDQVRLRANLKEMPSTAAAYKRYLEKFDQQETQIEDYQKQVKSLQTVEHNQRKEFEDFLANFSAE